MRHARERITAMSGRDFTPWLELIQSRAGLHLTVHAVPGADNTAMQSRTPAGRCGPTRQDATRAPVGSTGSPLLPPLERRLAMGYRPRDRSASSMSSSGCHARVEILTGSAVR